MTDLRILMVTTYYPPYHLGGDALHVKLLTDELKKAGHEVYVVHLLDPFFMKRGRDGVESHPEPDSHIFPIESPYGCLSIAKSYVFGHSRYIDRKVKKIVELVKPDVIHFHNIAGFGPSVLKIGSCFKIYTAHDYWPICPLNNLLNVNNQFCEQKGNCTICSIRSKRPPQLWRYRTNCLQSLGKMDVIIAPSNYMANTLKHNGFGGHIKIVPNFVPAPHESVLHAKINENSFFLYVGLLERHKGIIDLIDAYERMTELKTDLCVAGYGSQYDEILRESFKDKRIHVIGWVEKDKLSALYEQATAVVIPSKCPENNPLVAFEAISRGTPIIVMNVGGLPEIAEKIDKRLIYSSTSELTSILQNFEHGSFVFRNIPKVYEQYYSPQAYMERYLALIT